MILAIVWAGKLKKRNINFIRFLRRANLNNWKENTKKAWSRFGVRLFGIRMA